MSSRNPLKRVPDVNVNEIFNSEYNISERDYEKYGYGFLGEVKLNTKKGRMMLVSYSHYCADLGGEDFLTMQQKELLRRASTFAMICSELEEKLAEDGELDDKDFGRYMLASKALVNVLRALGTKGKAEPRTPEYIDLNSYIEEQYEKSTT